MGTKVAGMRTNGHGHSRVPIPATDDSALGELATLQRKRTLAAQAGGS